jgi:putative hydroxymethylpyrimidine transport system substrate-binding protein
MKRVSLMLEYFHPWPNSAGFYLARERGWYEAAGLELEIRLFDPARGDTLAHLLRNEVHFGVFPSNRLLVRREKGEPLIGIAAINHGGLETIQTVRRSGITRPRELEGRRIAMGPTPRGIAMLNHLVAHDGGDPGAVIIVDNRGREFTVDDIAAGEIDATFGGYWAWDALFGTLPDSERLTWRVDDIGAPRYHSYLLGTQDSQVRSDPDLVRQFLNATARGYLAAAADPGAALSAIERAIPYFPRPILKRSIELIIASWTHERRWGEQRASLLAPYAEWLHRHEILRSRDVWQDAVTNDFLPATSLAA